jgi:hypothetical protein
MALILKHGSSTTNQELLNPERLHHIHFKFHQVATIQRWLSQAPAASGG